MLNWIKFFLTFLFALALVITAFVFYKAYQPASAWKDDAQSLVLNKGMLASVDRAEVYNGSGAFTVVYGKDSDGIEKAVFVSRNAKKTNETKTVELDKGVTAQQAVTSVTHEMNIHKLLHVKLGLEDNEPVWEVAFKNEANKLNYVYVSFSNGKWQKRILNL